MAQRTAVVTGITGQDGSYLADLLLSKGYRVTGIKRRNASHSLGCAAHLERDVEIVEADLTDLPSLIRVLASVRPSEVYNLAAQSHVRTSFDQPVTTTEVNAIGTLNCLEAIRQCALPARFYQASSSEMFGKVSEAPQTERTPFHPRSPYGVSKLYAHWITVNYRESYGMPASSGILFNHESERRGPNFVTRKITLGVADIIAGRAKEIRLGNIDAKRDWGYAPDYVAAMWLMLQQEDPGDYVIATGETRSVREFLQVAFERAGLGGYEPYVTIDPAFYRPAEVDVLCGDPGRAREKLGWRPRTSFAEMVRKMVDADLRAVRAAP